MPQQVIVRDRKYFFQHSNGDSFLINPSNFSSHLSGNVFEKVKAVFTVQASWFDRFVDSKRINRGGGVVEIIKEGQNFDQTFAVGDSITLNIVSVNVYTGDVIYVGTDRIILDNFSDPAIPSDESNSSEYWMKGTTLLTALNYTYGFPENEDPYSTISRLTGVDQAFFINEIDGTLKIGTAKGAIKGHITGGLKVKYLGATRDDDLSGTYLTVQNFEIEQEFRLLPNYQEGELSNIQNILAPELFAGERTIKQVLGLDFRRTLNNPNTSKIGQDEGFLGSVGWFNENFNGLPNNYSFENLTKTLQSNGLPVSSVDIGDITEVQFDIVDANGGFIAGQPFVLNHVYLPLESVYSVSTVDFDETWIAESFRVIEGAAVASGSIIKNAQVTIQSATRVTVNYELSYSPAQGERLAIGDYYHLFVLVGSDPANVNDSDKVQLSIELGQFDKNTDVDGLISLESFLITNLRKEQRTNYIGAIEDGLIADIRLSTDLSLGATIDTWSFAVIAYNPTTLDYFVIDQRELNSSFIALPSGGQPVDRQFIEFSEQAGFVVEDQDYNLIEVKSDTFDGTNQFYDIKVGFKIPWQDNQAIDANIAFFDSTKQNNGLNKNASNYSNENGYEVRFALIAEMFTPESIGNTTYLITNQGNEIYNYDEVI